MNICFLGQATGGNAMLWCDFFNHRLRDYPEVERYTLLCRTKCTLDTRFHTVKAYGTGKMPRWLYRFYAPWVSRMGLRMMARRMARKTQYDVLHLQGNYNPGLNLQVMDALKCKTVLNIYGSDFYRRYLLDEFNGEERTRFEEVVRRADHIVCNWISTQRDFLKSFPSAANKCSVQFWGYDEKWREPAPKLMGWPDAEKVFLSARGVYAYNNIDVVVEAFCQAYKDKPGHKLFVVNGYGNHAHAIDKVKAVIEKYCAQSQVIMRVGQWITDEQLMALYERADYNICFGSTDQLTISICYAFEKEAANILSPLRNYHDLRGLGYRSLQIVDEISVEALTTHFKALPESDPEALQADKALGCKHFNMHHTFNGYMAIYREITRSNIGEHLLT